MHKLNVTRAGAAVAVFAGLWHTAWAGLVAAGWAQPLLDFIFRLHFLRTDWRVDPFDAGVAALLVLLTAVVGFAAGAVLALIWNRVALRP